MLRPETTYRALSIVANAGPDGVDVHTFVAAIWPDLLAQRDPARRARLRQPGAGLLGKLAALGYAFRVGRGRYQRFGLTAAGLAFLERWAEEHMRAPTS